MSVSNENLILNRFYGSPGQIGRLLLASTLVCLGSQIVSPVAAGIGKDLEACEAFYGPSEMAGTEMLQSGMFGDVGKSLPPTPTAKSISFGTAGHSIC